jgi:lipopolysaccharide transport system ATP-binding protein
MKEKAIIEVKNIGKKYDINRGKGGYIALRDVITNIIKKPFAFLKTKVRSAAGLSKKEEFWALRDINFEVKKGEIIGIIGPNGAGKSTLLKILSQITPPTTGEIKIHGSVGSLLEVGTGFHPELSGRENIFLNGAILGMTRKEIARKFDQIVEFSGIEKFIDTPVKYYSSGMYVRLAFSVAAHMEPDILIVDEVLAVGDAEFQKKCLGKMEDITKADGRTILFVSHNLDAIERLCTKTILLKNGEINKIGKTADIIDYYLNKEHNANAVTIFPHKENLEGQITKVSILNKDKELTANIPVSENFYIEIEFEARKVLKNKLIMLDISYHGEKLLFSTEGDMDGKYRDYEIGKYKTLVEIPGFVFQIGIIFITIVLRHMSDGRGGVDKVINIPVEIKNENNPRNPVMGENHFGKISTILTYTTEKIL